MSQTATFRRETAAEKALRRCEVNAASIRLALRRAGLEHDVYRIASGKHFTYVYLRGLRRSFYRRDSAGRELSVTTRAQRIVDALNAAFPFSPRQHAYVEEPWSVAVWRRQP